MIRHETWAWCDVRNKGNEQTAETSAWNKKVLLMLYYIDKNWYHFINFIEEYLEQFSKFSFQKVARSVRPPKSHILEVLFVRRHTFVTQNRRATVNLHLCIPLFSRIGPGSTPWLWVDFYFKFMYVILMDVSRVS